MQQVFAIPDRITGDTLREVRYILKLSRRDFAQFCGASERTVEYWENSGKELSGPVVTLVRLLQEDTGLIARYRIPKQKTPLRLLYRFRENIYTIIDIDEASQLIEIRNYTQRMQFRAFGGNEHPSYKDYQEFLESRCFPKTRDKMKLMLNELGLPFYDPLLIIEKTEGRMEEDDFWIQVVRRG